MIRYTSIFKNYARPWFNKNEGQGDLEWGKKNGKEIFPHFEKSHRRFILSYLHPHKKLVQKRKGSLHDQGTKIFDSTNLDSKMKIPYFILLQLQI